MMEAVNSTSVNEVGYDKESQDLHVIFAHADTHYVYRNVPEATYNDLMESSSIGRFVNAEIKTQFNCDRV